MNFLSSQDESVKTRFEVNASADPCTHGVWMFIYVKNQDEAILLFDTEVLLLFNIFYSTISFNYSKGLEANTSDKNWDNKLFLFNLLISSLLIYYTQGVIERSKMIQIGEMTQLCCEIIKNKTNQDDNPDLLWILRDFDLKVNDANGYLEDQIKKNDQKIFNFFIHRHCRFLLPWNNKDKKYKDSINYLKSSIFNSL